MQEMTMELNQLKNNMPFTIARYFKSSWIDIEPDVKSIVWFVNEALFGNSPSRNILTVVAAPLMTFLMHWSYGRGVLQGWMRIRSGESGLQIDDRNRS